MVVFFFIMTEENPFQSLLLKQQSHFHQTVKKATIWERKQKLKAIRKWIKSNDALIIQELQKDFKKTPEEIMISEIKPVIGEIRDALNNIRFWAREDHKKTPLALLGTRAKVMKEPKGVALIIAPWNFPFMLSIGPLISAIAAGCCAVVKPSENTPHAEKLVAKLIHDVFPAEEVACVTGGIEETTQLLALKWDHIFFTGSPMVGSIVMTAAAKHLTPVTLELGGLNPVVVDQNANLKDTATKLMWGKYLNCGQSCVSPNYVLVPEKIYDAFVKELLIAYDKRFGEDHGDFARIVNTQHFQRVKRLVDNSISEGAQLIKGGYFKEEDNFIAPTIIGEISTQSLIFKEEIFGPVLPLMKYNNLSDAIQIINNNEKPLALYVFTKSSSFSKQIIASTSAGTTVINDTSIQFTHPNLPFGGINHSGIGKAHGEYGYKEFTNERAILKQRRGFTTAKLIYPPFNGLKRWIVKVVTWKL